MPFSSVTWAMWHRTCTVRGQADNYNMTCREQVIAHKCIMNDIKLRNVSFHLIQLQWSWSLVSLVPTVPSATIPQLYHNSTNIYISSNDPPESALMKTLRSQNLLPSVAIRVTFKWLVRLSSDRPPCTISVCEPRIVGATNCSIFLIIHAGSTSDRDQDLYWLTTFTWNYSTIYWNVGNCLFYWYQLLKFKVGAK